MDKLFYLLFDVLVRIIPSINRELHGYIFIILCSGMRFFVNVYIVSKNVIRKKLLKEVMTFRISLKDYKLSLKEMEVNKQNLIIGKHFI